MRRRLASKQAATDRQSPKKDEILNKMRDDLAKRNNEINFVYVPKKKKDKTPTKPFHFANNVKLMPLVV